MQTPLERAARAAQKAFGDLTQNYHPFESILSPEAAEHIARTVLEAIREPSEAMCSVYYDLEPIHAQDSLSANDAWQAMLDTVIKGE